MININGNGNGNGNDSLCCVVLPKELNQYLMIRVEDFASWFCFLRFVARAKIGDGNSILVLLDSNNDMWARAFDRCANHEARHAQTNNRWLCLLIHGYILVLSTLADPSIDDRRFTYISPKIREPHIPYAPRGTTTITSHHITYVQRCLFVAAKLWNCCVDHND